MTRSLYAILNVSPDADPAVIEAAHRALIKKYHPDVVVGEPENVQRRAAEINEAFQILRDPEKRARYDAGEQARREAARSSLPGNEGRPQVLRPQPPRTSSRWITLLVVAAMAALVLYVWQVTSNGDKLISAGDSEATGTTKAAFGSLAELPVSLIQVDRAISEYRRLKETSGLLGLSAYSQDCFARQSQSSASDDFDFCVAFDDAVLTYESGGSGFHSLPNIPRFEPREMALRHAAAGTFVSDDEAWVQERLRAIKELTEQRLAQANAVPVQTAAAAAPQAAPQAANVPRPPVRSAPTRSRPSVDAARPAPRAARPAYRAPPRTTARRPPPQRRKATRKGTRRPADADFMERQGYIY